MRVLFVDDEKRRMSPVVEELQLSGHDVVFEAKVDEALARLRDLSQAFDLIVLDISMPPGEAFRDHDTDGGARTGIYLYDEIRRVRPQMKVIVLTNVADRTVASHFGGFDETLCRFLRKQAFLPFQFVEEAEHFVQGTG